mmetsp:Transcript_37662/g.67494  ORF Transcript_37662/g.67494 Transcript_37662/m.67494 type:complete len:126 (-) Transcript_37662:458-835(-)
MGSNKALMLRSTTGRRYVALFLLVGLAVVWSVQTTPSVSAALRRELLQDEPGNDEAPAPSMDDKDDPMMDDTMMDEEDPMMDNTMMDEEDQPMMGDDPAAPSTGTPLTTQNPRRLRRVSVGDPSG